MGQPYLKYHSDDEMGFTQHKVIKLVLNTDVSIANSTTTTLWAVTTSPFQPEGVMHDSDNGKIYFPTTGWYMLIFNCTWDTGTTGRRYIDIRTNNAKNQTTAVMTSITTDKDYQMCFALYKVEIPGYQVGDYLECRVWHNEGAALLIKKFASTSFQYYKVRNL